ncbi:kelch repeat and BTB domain-containing protein 7 [Biomphalaria glabrata]|nr:kelch repeat and BTB domain-containing protein 7-like [Biomphalaria glabrata]
MYAVASEELMIKNEDIVLRSMFEWAEYNQMQLQENLVEVSQKKTKLDNSVPGKGEVLGDPSSKFSKLLRASRYGLASVECLVELSKHQLCEEDKEAKLVITEAISYKLERNVHGYWPHYALHRNGHVFRHIGVLASKD